MRPPQRRAGYRRPGRGFPARLGGRREDRGELRPLRVPHWRRSLLRAGRRHDGRPCRWPLRVAALPHPVPQRHAAAGPAEPAPGAGAADHAPRAAHHPDGRARPAGLLRPVSRAAGRRHLAEARRHPHPGHRRGPRHGWRRGDRLGRQHRKHRPRLCAAARGDQRGEPRRRQPADRDDADQRAFVAAAGAWAPGRAARRGVHALRGRGRQELPQVPAATRLGAGAGAGMGGR